MKFIIALIIIGLILFVYSAAILAGREDEWMERRYREYMSKQHHEYIKSKNKDNNNQNNEGE